MAVVTHGGTLPDSSQKTDFYALIDNGTVTGIVNADISNSAAIADTKLASITTASKVNVSAITGTLGTANGGTGATANTNAASGVVVLDSSSRLPAVSGALLTNLPSPTGILGANVTKLVDTVYQAATDGFAYASFASSTNPGGIRLYSDASNPPTTIVSMGYTSDAAGVIRYQVFAPINKSNYYKFTQTGTLAFDAGPFFMPMGI